MSTSLLICLSSSSTYLSVYLKKEREQSAVLASIKEEEPTLLGSVMEDKQSALDAHNCSGGGRESQSKTSEEIVANPEKFQPFIKEEVLTSIFSVSICNPVNFSWERYLLLDSLQDVFPCTVEQFFRFVIDDDSTFTIEYHIARKDSNMKVRNRITHGNGFFTSIAILVLCGGYY